MEKDLTSLNEIVTAECFSCKETFRLFDVQKMGFDFCRLCGISNSLVKLTTLPMVSKKIVAIAEQENQKINDRLVVDVSKLIEGLQGDR